MMFFLKKKIIFVYAPLFKQGGGTTMRGEQLSNIVKEHINSSKYKVLYLPFGKKFTNSILFMTKMSLQEATGDQLMQLKQDHNTIIFDPNDSVIQDDKMKFIDVLIAVSGEAFTYYKRRYPNKRVFLINHHVDPRLDFSIEKQSRSFKGGVFWRTTKYYIYRKHKTTRRPRSY